MNTDSIQNDTITDQDRAAMALMMLARLQSDDPEHVAKVRSDVRREYGRITIDATLKALPDTVVDLVAERAQVEMDRRYFEREHDPAIQPSLIAVEVA